jgi:hypothetical protein
MAGSVLVIQDDAKTNGRGGVTLEDWRKILVQYILEPSKLKDTKTSVAGLAVHSCRRCAISVGCRWVVAEMPR